MSALETRAETPDSSHNGTNGSYFPTPVDFVRNGFPGIISVAPHGGVLKTDRHIPQKPHPAAGKLPARRIPGDPLGRLHGINHLTEPDATEMSAREIEATGMYAGLRTRRNPVWDIDTPDTAVQDELGRDAIAELGQAPRRLSRGPAYLYGTREPIARMGLTLTDPSGVAHHAEWLGDKQQVVVWGKSKDGKPIEWDRVPVGNELTDITREQVYRFLEKEAEKYRARGWKTEITGDGRIAAPGSVEAQEGFLAPSLADLRAAVDLIPNKERDYHHYIRVGYAIRAAAGDEFDAGYEIFASWAERIAGDDVGVYAAEPTRDYYRRFRPPFKAGWGWLCDLAKEHGYDPPSDFDEILPASVTVDAEAPPGLQPAYRLLRDLMSDPALLAPPVAVLSRLAYRGRTTLLSAREKFGKSTMLRGGAAAVSNGTAFLDDSREQGTVLWCGEENISDMVRAFSDLGANPDAIYILDLRSFGKNRIDEVCAAMAALRPSLVIIDTLISLTAGIVLDSSKDSQITPIISRIAGLAARLNCACLLSHHSTKSGSGYHGSMAYGALVDCVLELKAPGDDPTSPIRRVSGMGRWPVEDFTLRFNSTSRTYALSDAMTPLDRARIFIRANPGCTKSQLQKELSLRSEAVSRLRSELIASGIVRDVGAGRNWSLEIDHAADFDENLGDTLVDGAPFVPREKKPAATKPAAETVWTPPSPPIAAPVDVATTDVSDTAPPPTFEDARAAMFAVAAAKGEGAGRELLAEFAVSHVSRLGPERYADFIAKANAART